MTRAFRHGETRSSRLHLRAVMAALPVAVFSLCALALWEAYVRISEIPPQVLPAPSRVFEEGWALRALIWSHAVPTLQATGLGFTLSMAVATVFAVVIDFSRTVRSALYPVLVASQTIPIIALAPLMVIWFGFGLGPKVAVVVLVTFFPITVGWVDGFKSTEPGALHLLRSMGASRWQLFHEVRVPSALPSFFSGLRIAIVYAVVGAIFAEYVGARYGLGIFMQLQKNSFRTDLVLAAVFVTATISIVLFLSTFVVERLVIPWYFAARRHSNG